jgi:predicted metal-dependent hydrolase
VSRKSARIAALVKPSDDETLDPHYLGYFDCFNRGLFFEAHDVLEALWLKDKYGPNGAFYKGLIQLAGAFVHLQKNRLRPAAALFKLALANLENYPRRHEHLNLATVCSLAQKWLDGLESAPFEKNPLAGDRAPKLALELPHLRD